MAVLPPMAASTCPTSVVGHGDPRHAAHVGRGGEAHDVRGAATTERDERTVATDPKRRPEALERGNALRRLARGNLVHADVARSKRQLRPHSVDPRDVRVCDELERPAPGDQLGKALEPTGLHVNRGRGQNRTVDIVGRVPSAAST